MEIQVHRIYFVLGVDVTQYNIWFVVMFMFYYCAFFKDPSVPWNSSGSAGVSWEDDPSRWPRIHLDSRHKKKVDTWTQTTSEWGLWVHLRWVHTSKGSDASELVEAANSSCHVTYLTLHNHLLVYLSREKFPIIPFARTAAAVLLPAASAPQPPQHPPVGSKGGLQVFAHPSHHSCVVLWGSDEVGA